MSDVRIDTLLMRQARTRKTPRPPDPAEMGTAFGLEYTLDQAALPASGEHPAPTGGQGSGWLRRWMGSKAGK